MWLKHQMFSLYFSVVSTKFELNNWYLDVLEAKPHGQLLKYDQSMEETSIVLDGLCFPNGVSFSQDEFSRGVWNMEVSQVIASGTRSSTWFRLYIFRTMETVWFDRLMSNLLFQLTSPLFFFWLGRFRCLKYWLKGETKGQTEIFVENLPAGPDNINLAPDGSFWIALIQVFKLIQDSTITNSLM